MTGETTTGSTPGGENAAAEPPAPADGRAPAQGSGAMDAPAGAGASDGDDDRDSWRRWLWLGLTATLAALAGGVAVLLFTYEPGALAALDRLGAPLALSLLALVLTAWAAAALRLILLTRALGHALAPRRAATTALAAEFGASASPAGVGGVAVRLALLRSYGVPIAESAAVAGADFAVEATSGFLIGSGILLFALLRPDSRAVLDELVTGEAARRASLPLLAAVAVLVAIGLAVRWSMRRGAPGRVDTSAPAGGAATGGAEARPGAGGGRRLPRAGGGRLPGAGGGRLPRAGGGRTPSAGGRLWSRSRGSVEAFRVRLAVLRRHPRTLLLCLLLAGAQILARYSVLPVLVWAFTGESSPFLLFLVQGTVMAISQVLVAPGGGGSVELGAGALLPTFLPSHLTGIVVILWRLFTYHLNLIVGGAAFFAWMGAKGRKTVVERVRRRGR